MIATSARPAALVALLLLVSACTTSDDPSPPAAADAPTTTVEIGPDDRPAQLVAPGDVTALAPLVVVLHGYASSSGGMDAYLGVTAQAASRGLYVLLPDGTAGDDGRQFWDATPACCNFTGTPVDDVAYLSDLIGEAIETQPIDPTRIYVFGHSNGGFMAYRMACERADQITAIAVLAGSEFIDENACDPSQPVSVLHAHGNADRVIRYDGGQTVGPYPYPGAVEIVGRWAQRNGCDGESVGADPLDLDTGLAGAETVVQRYEGCQEGIGVQLDTIVGGRHVPALDREQVGAQVLDWLLDHAR